MTEELSITFVADATTSVVSEPAFETVMVIPTVEVLVCAGGILFPADGTAAGAEGTLPGDPPLADV